MKKIIKFSVRKKLVLTFIGTVLLAILLTALIFSVLFLIVYNHDSYGIRELIRAQVLVRERATAVQEVLNDGRDQEALEAVALPTELDPDEQVQIIDMKGTVWAASNDNPGRVLTSTEILHWLPPSEGQVGMRALTYPLTRDGEMWGYYVLKLKQPVLALEKTPASRLIPFAFFSVPLLALITSLLLFWFFGHHLVAPVRRVSAVMARLAAGDFRARINESKRTDEIGQLERDVNIMAAKLQQAKEEAEIADGTRRYLAAAASHDLRTPLTALLAHAELLKDGIAEKPSQSISVIHDKGLMLKGLIDNLFELISLEAGTSEAWQTKRLNLTEVVRQTVISFLPSLEEKGFTVDVEIPDQALWAELVPGKIERVLDNLLTNAVNYGSQGLWIGVKVSRLRGWFRVDVADGGQGVAPEDRNRVFERFFRGDLARNSSSGGSGLGLAICKEIIQRHGGEIGVDSSPGGGALFWFTIPIVIE
ncbi:MAG: HAMP domain-containing histidine kinase [Firmicutes bacterium]|nr:HAMP domain-containing histidine kinase [Bacillota bacterium]